LRLIVGISGASGVIMGWYLLRALHEMPEVKTHLIITEGASVTFPYETELSLAEVCAFADVVHDNHDMAASISSGSYETDGMIIIPCSMKTVAGIVSGYTDDLLLRAADVCLKEGRKVVIVPREMPMSRIHLRNIKEAADYGCCVVPPVLTFYNGADTVEKQIQHIIGKVLMQFHLHSRDFVPWQGSDAAER
jgi:4-hydroxy-3-polyprenylbenzoate decarboxylase